MRTRKSMGIIYGMSPLHIVCTSFANSPDNMPLEPNGLTVFTAVLQRPSNTPVSVQPFIPSVCSEQRRKGRNQLTRKKLRKRQRRAQTLYRRIHITRIPQILQPRRPHPNVAPIRRRIVARDPRRVPTAPTSTNTNPGLPETERLVPLGRSCRSSADDATAGGGRRMCCADG
jgi:hypothetical protein